MKFTYLKQPIRRYTFEAPKIKEWVQKNCKGRVLNLFAGKTILKGDIVRVDLNSKVKPDYNMDAYEFVKKAVDKKLKFDTIILDPPYSYRKSMEKYNGIINSNFKRLKDLLPDILEKNGKIITFGYHSVSMGSSRGFEQKEILLISHGGAQHDTIAVIEKEENKI